MHARYQSRTPPPVVHSDTRCAQGIDAKVVVLGSSGVGKTALLHRYTQPRSPFARQDAATPSFVTKKVSVDGVKVRLQLWDTSAQEPFRSMARMYYRGADAALLLYDSNDASTLDDVRRWLEELRHNAPDLLVYIVGTKADIFAHSTVTTDLARALLRKSFPAPPQKHAHAQTPATPKPRSFSQCLRLPFQSLTSIVSLGGSAPASDRRNSPRARYDSEPESASAPLLRRALSEAGASETLPRRALHHTRSMSQLTTHFFESDNGHVQCSPAQSVHGNDTPGLVVGDENAPWTGLPYQLEFFQVSAQDNLGVRDLFDHLVSAIAAKALGEADDIADSSNSDDGFLTPPPVTPTSATPSSASSHSPKSAYRDAAWTSAGPGYPHGVY